MPFDRVNQCKWNLWDEVILSLLISSWDEVILPLGCAFLPFCSICRCGLLERKIICKREEKWLNFIYAMLELRRCWFLLSKTKSGFLYLYQKFRILVISTGTTILFVVFCDPGFAVKVDHSCSSVGRAWVLWAQGVRTITNKIRKEKKY